MTWLRYCLALTLIFNLAFPAQASTAPVQNMWTLVESMKEATKHMKALEGKTEQETILATQQGMLEAIAQEGASLNAEDYKEFLFESMERYVAHPDERMVLYAIWKYIGGAVAPEIASYETQFWQPIANGLGNWLFLFVLLRSPTQYLLERAGNPAALTRLAESNIPGRLLSKMGITDELHQALVLSGVGAATIGAMQRVFANSGPHKLDPTPIFEAYQIFIGCDLMHAAVDQNLNADQIKDILAQSDLLVEQFGDLTSLNPNDQRAQQIIASIPNNPEWTRLTGQNFRCDAVNLEHLHRYLTKKLVTMLEKPK